MFFATLRCWVTNTEQSFKNFKFQNTTPAEHPMHRTHSVRLVFTPVSQFCPYQNPICFSAFCSEMTEHSPATRNHNRTQHSLCIIPGNASTCHHTAVSHLITRQVATLQRPSNSLTLSYVSINLVTLLIQICHF